MSYPNLLMDPNDVSGAATLRQQRAAKLKEYYKKHKEERRATERVYLVLHVFDEKDDLLGVMPEPLRAILKSYTRGEGKGKRPSTKGKTKS